MLVCVLVLLHIYLLCVSSRNADLFNFCEVLFFHMVRICVIALWIAVAFDLILLGSACTW